MIASWVILLANARAFRALTLGEDAAISLGVDLQRTRFAVVLGTAFGVGARLRSQARSVLSASWRRIWCGVTCNPIRPA